MAITSTAIEIFNRCIDDYHQLDDVDVKLENPYDLESLEHLLYEKSWIDTVQWHLEDLIRDIAISPEKALMIKRKIDSLNQKRTDLVEKLDDWFFNLNIGKVPQPNAIPNTETPAWAMDRLSILCLKIYHMRQESIRSDADEKHRMNCSERLTILLRQREDLTEAIEILLKNIGLGKVRVNTYRQMKMYNDEALNPILYQSKKNDRKSL